VVTDSRAVAARGRRRRKTSTRVRVQRGALAFVLLAVAGSALGLAFAGSPGRIAAGVRIEGVDVGGLKPHAAERLLERRARKLQRVPVMFTAGERRWRVTPEQLGVRADWHAAVAIARRHGDGFGPFRGFRRIGVRVFGAQFAPPTRVYDAALAYELNRFARALYRPHRNPQLRLRRLEPIVTAGLAGRTLDRAAAARVVVAALAGFARQPVALPVRSELPPVSVSQLDAAAGGIRVALSAPVQMRWRLTTWTINPWQLRAMLALPRRGASTLRIGERSIARPETPASRSRPAAPSESSRLVGAAFSTRRARPRTSWPRLSRASGALPV
jgi:hypothetical protein